MAQWLATRSLASTGLTGSHLRGAHLQFIDGSLGPLGPLGPLLFPLAPWLGPAQTLLTTTLLLKRLLKCLHREYRRRGLQMEFLNLKKTELDSCHLKTT